MTAPTGKPPGRPSSIAAVVGSRPKLDDDGKPTGERQPITAGDRIVQHLRSGGYFETGCAAAGVAKSTGYRWLREGARIWQQLEGIDTDDARLAAWAELTPTQQLYAEFSDSVARAEAEAMEEDVARLQQLARGGMTATTVTEKADGTGVVTERTTKVETLLPDAATLRWRLERRHPDLFGRQRVEITGVDGAPVELTVAEKRERVAADLAARAEQLAADDAAVDAPVEPVEDGDAAG